MSVLVLNNVVNKKEMLKSIHKFESFLNRFENTELETSHHFFDGLYIRRLVIPQGTALTGKVHKTQHLNIIPEGDIITVTEDGSKRIKAPHMMVSKPGTKRAGFALKDTVWITIHRNEDNTRDLKVLESRIIKPPQIEDEVKQ